MLSAPWCKMNLMKTLKTNQNKQRLENEIAKIKQQIVQLDDLRPGTLSEQYNVCGTPGCRCKASPPQKHGPYHQLSLTRRGKSKTRFDGLPSGKISGERHVGHVGLIRIELRSR